VIVGLIIVVIIVMFGVINWAIQLFSTRLRRGCWVLSKAGGALGGSAVRVVEVGGGVVGGVPVSMVVLQSKCHSKCKGACADYRGEWC